MLVLVLVSYPIIGLCTYTGVLWAWSMGYQQIDKQLITALRCLVAWPWIWYQIYTGFHSRKHRHRARRLY